MALCPGRRAEAGVTGSNKRPQSPASIEACISALLSLAAMFAFKQLSEDSKGPWHLLEEGLGSSQPQGCDLEGL